MDTERWVLATDLDGTFLAGSKEERLRFYRYLRSLNDEFMLIFVTGRELENTIPLFEEEPELPRPRYIICDIGTQAVDGMTFEPIQTIQSWVDIRWNSASARIKSLLADEPGIVLQPQATTNRVSYFYHDDYLRPRTLKTIQQAGFDYLLSDERYLDVLPPGVAKGPTLLRLLNHVGLHEHQVLVAGDTLNDLSLFETGLRGIAMSNSEAKLLAAVETMDHVYRSRYHGVMGIWEGLAAHGVVDQVSIRIRTDLEMIF